ncbi:RE1 [Symbiodinium microadriaticum]|nr:RE1 [Symbiodinium microadriaticum]
MWVLYWTKKSSPNRLAAGRWHGPAKVICAEGKSIVWVAHGTTIIRSAPENLRPASLREWQSLTDSQLDQSWKHTGGASSFLDLTGAPADSAPPENPHVRPPMSTSEILPMPVPSTALPSNDQAAPVADEIGQPEQELTPQVSQGGSEVERDAVAAPSADSGVPEITNQGSTNDNPPDPQSIPVPGSDEGLCADSIFLASEAAGFCDDDGSELLNFTTLEGDSEACGPPLAEDNLPFVNQPLLNTAERAYCLEVPLKPKEVKRWKKEESAGHLIAVAAAMKRARAEVCLKDLTAKELELFDAAKQKEINCWVQTSAIRGILRQKLNPEQILKSRWILTWKPPEEGETQQRAKEGRAVVLQTIASRRYQLSSFDIKTAFLRGKADASNPLAMEPPKELRKALSLRDDEVCELLGNAYGRVDAPLLFYKELSRQLFSLGFTRHPLEPCVFMLYQHGELRGILGMHVDDGVGGGDEVFRKKIDELQKTLPFGSRKFDSFTFTGIHLQQYKDGSILASQSDYVRSIPHIDIGRFRRQNLEDPANEGELSKLRGLIGSLQYAITHTRPDMAAKLGEIQSQTSRATVQTLLAANRVLREAQETSQVSIRYLSIPVARLTFVAFGDASFASAKNLHSHQGALICATDEKLSLNQEAPVSPVAWTSKKIPRVVRSTLSAEAYAMSKGVDILGWVRALWGGINVSGFNWQQPEVGFKQLPAATIVTDCKSLYDLVTRLAMPSCEEFRTTLEVLLIKQRCQENCQFRWIPTTLQVADSLTKPMDPTLLRMVLAQGRFRLYDASENLNKTAQRKEAVRWLSQPSQMPFSSTSGA